MTLKIHCPECRGQFQVDGEESRSRFECPFCSAPFRFQDKQTVVLSSSPLTRVEVERVAQPVAEESGAPLPEAAPATDAPPPLPEAAAAAPGTGTRRRTPVERPEDLTPLRPGDVLGGYRLEEVIGWGGMSVVFRAKQLSLGRNVAVKVLRHELGEDPEFSRRFLNEAKALAELAHPNIVNVIDQGIHEGNPYLVMEYIDGVSLREVLSERRLSPAEALRLIPDLCAALEYAHDRGIIHRDIKPENILVTRSGLPKIADFGLVRILGTNGEQVSRLTQTRTIMGTVDYMAPEQREGQSDVDHRADIYSLGVVLYEMLTGELPIARFPLPSERVQVDVRLDDVVLKVLQKDRDRRYQRASLVASDLASFDGSVPFGPPRSEPRSRLAHLLGRVGALVWFPLVLAFFGVASRDEDMFLAVFGASIPWLLTHLRSYGWVPAIPDALRGYRWTLWAGAGLMFVFFQSHVIEDEPGVFAVAFLVSSAFASGRKVWREGGVVPPPPARRPGRPEAASHPSAGIVAAPASRAEGPEAAIPTRVSHAHAPSASQLPARPGSTHTTPPISPENREEGAVSTTAARSPFAPAVAAPEPRPRASVPLILAFILSLLTLVPTAGLSTALLVTGDTWQSVLLNAPMEFDEVQDGVREVAGFSPEPARAAVSMGRLMMLLPLAIPGFFALLSLPGVLNGRRRSRSLLLAVSVILGLQAGLMVASTRPVVSAVDEYCDIYERSAEAGVAGDPMRVVLDRAVASEDPVERLALLHRASALGADRSDPDSGSGLVRMALDSRLTPQERKVSLALLERKFGTELTREDSFGAVPDWLALFAEQASPDSSIQRELRDGFVEVLSRIPRPELAALFSDLVERSASRTSLVALRWWTQVAPEDSFETWTAELERRGVSPGLSQTIDRLHRYDGGSNARVVHLASLVPNTY